FSGAIGARRCVLDGPNATRSDLDRAIAAIRDHGHRSGLDHDLTTWRHLGVFSEGHKAAALIDQDRAIGSRHGRRTYAAAPVSNGDERTRNRLAKFWRQHSLPPIRYRRTERLLTTELFRGATLKKDLSNANKVGCGGGATPPGLAASAGCGPRRDSLVL